MSRDYRIEIEYISEKDLSLTCRECGEIRYLESLVDEEISFAEKYLCEMNAMEIRRLACALELEAYKCRKAYEKWAKNSFEDEGKK